MATIREILEQKFGCAMEDIPTDKLMDCLEGGMKQTLSEIDFGGGLSTKVVTPEKLEKLTNEDFDL